MGGNLKPMHRLINISTG